MKKMLKFSAILAMFTGLVFVFGGLWAIYFTYQNVTAEKIVTPEDSAMPGLMVRGPFTLKTQADIIRKHTLKITEGKTYAEMPRQIQKTDEKGNLIVDQNGKPAMVDNVARNIWITATTLTTALHLAIITYVLSGFVILFGLISLWTGFVFLRLSSRQ